MYNIFFVLFCFAFHFSKPLKFVLGVPKWNFFFFAFFFFLLFHFSKPLKFVLGVPKWKFSTGKKHFMPGRKIKKNDFAPGSENFSCYAPVEVCVWGGLVRVALARSRTGASKAGTQRTKQFYSVFGQLKKVQKIFGALQKRKSKWLCIVKHVLH